MNRSDSALPNERAQALLKVLVQRYIRDGQPVGSKALLEEAALSVSPATVRNIMADLEAQGYVASPHTSAGRMPTDRGYRAFVDSMLTMAPLDDLAVSQLQSSLTKDKTPAQLVESASKMLSEFSAMTGLIVAPKQVDATIRHIEFLPLSGKRVLVVLVQNQQDVQNRIIQVDREYSEVELKQASNMLNEKFVGCSLSSVQAALLAAAQQDHQQMSGLMTTALDVTRQAMTQEDSEPDMLLSGEANLLSLAEQGSMAHMRELFEAFQHKSDVLHLLDRSVSANGVQIFIGAESGCHAFNECSVVSAPYEAAGSAVGVLAVVGPTRMNYDRVIPLVDVTAKILSAALNPS